MTIINRTVVHEHRGESLHGLMALDDTANEPRPAVIVVHAWRGRGDFECAKAVELAQLEYVGFAADLYGGAKVGSSKEENTKLMQPFMDDRAFLQSRLLSIVDTVKERDEVDASYVAAIGFCFGGLCVLDLARTGASISGVVSFHGLLKPPGNTQGQTIQAKVLVLHGNDDPMVSSDDVTALEHELTGAGTDWQIQVYGNAMHAFTNPEANDPEFGTVYNEDADRRSWRAMVNFLGEIFATNPA